MKSLGRSRSLRGNASPVPVESPGREREPFCLGPFRQQKGFALPSTPSRNRSRANGENVPPDNNHTAATVAYVKANTQTPDTVSPAQPKSSRKGRNNGVAPLPGSPALLPRPPSAKPSPVAAKAEPPIAQVQENLGAAKRKLLWDGSASSAPDAVGFTVPADSVGVDSGVQVILRMRPLNSKEEQEEAIQIVQKISADAVALGDQQFTYDAVAGERATQHELFEMVGLPMVENCLAGFNSSIFAYGQTGSGKTHTMMGVPPDPDSSSSPSEERGLTFRVFERLFSRMQQEEKIHMEKGLRYQCRCSFLEIYNEQITDLFEPTLKNLQIREDTKKTGVYVDSLGEEFVSNVDDVTRLLLKGLTNRRTATTIMNNESSRSHCVFTCVIESRFKNLADGGNSVRSSRMNLVDLAGSERQKQTGAAGERLKEAGNINKSLSQLGNVINILAEVAQTGRQRHIPYRDSRLTFLLQESLGGNAKLAMICAISPASSCRSETLSTLRFAQRAKAIQNKAVVNEETASDVGLLREQIRLLKDELMRMKSNGNQEAGEKGYSNGWNARRSYNLLRLSLSHPMNLSAAGLEDTDLEMEIEENDKEPEPEILRPEPAGKDTTKDGVARLPVIDEKEWLVEEDTAMDMDDSETPATGIKDTSDSAAEVGVIVVNATLNVPHSPLKADFPIDSGLELLSNMDDDSVNIGSEAIPSPELVKTPEAMKIPELMIPRALHSPPLSVSPRLKGTSKRGLSGSPLAPRPETVVNDLPSANALCEEIYHSTQEIFCDRTSTSQSLQLKNGALHQSNVRASMSMSSARPTEKLAACLQRGLQILDNQQRSSMASVRRSTAGLRFSIQGSDIQIPRLVDKIDKGVQTSPTLLVTTSTSPLAQSARSPAVEAISNSKVALALTDDHFPALVSPSSESPDCLLRDPKEGHLRLTTCLESLGDVVKEPDSGDFQLSPSIESLRGVVDELNRRSGSDNSQIQPLSCIGPLDDVVEQQEGGGHLHLPSSNSVQEPENGNLQFSPSIQLSRGLVHDQPSRFLDDISSSNYHTPTSIASKSCDTSQWQLIALDTPKSVTAGHSSSPQLQLAQAVEALLTGAIRRERVAEEAMSKQAAEIEQLNRLVRQYKHERECNSILHQTREDKIARLESLMDNIIPTDTYLNEEWSALLLEYKVLQEKFDNHPEVTQSSVEQQRLLDELNQYRSFYDLGEREILSEEIKQLRNQLQNHLEHAGTPSTSGRQRRLSVARMSLQTTKFSEAAREDSSPPSLALFAVSQGGGTKQPSSDLCMVVTGGANAEQDGERGKADGVSRSNHYWEEEKREMEQDWEERERDWMAVLEELREEAEAYKSQAEKRKQEFECEKRCTEEMQDALQMAMTGHARLLEQYAELQEKHIGLLAKHRKIKEGTADVKKMAKKAGVSSVESRWLDAQALQIVALRVENEEERQRSKEEIDGLQAQLRDTADAVQAAGELLVRLKEAEESVIITQDAVAMAEQDANTLRRDMEKVRRRHATEVATLQQRLLESRLQKTAVCPMCVMAERVKFQFTEVDAETAQAVLEAEARSMALKEEQEWMAIQRQNLTENENQNQQEMNESVWTGELEDQGGYVSEELYLDEFDEIDHLFTHT